jgi:hypothetical protein
LADVQADRTVLSRLPRATLLDLQCQVRHLDVDIDAAIDRQPMARQGTSGTETERLVLIEEAARILATSTGSIHRKWKRLRLGFIDAIDGKWKITVRELEEYIRRSSNK